MMMHLVNGKQAIWFIFGLLLLSGCSSPQRNATNSSQQISPKAHFVEIAGMKFKPDTLYVQKGDSVVFVNKGIVIHNVTAPDSSWTSGPIAVGEKWGMKIMENTPYYCSIHVVMKGTIMMQ